MVVQNLVNILKKHKIVCFKYVNFAISLLYLKKPINVIYHTNSLNKKNHIILLTDAEKALQNPIFIYDKNSQKMINRGELPHLDKNLQKTLLAKIINGKRLNTFPLKSIKRKRCPLLPLLFDINTRSFNQRNIARRRDKR